MKKIKKTISLICIIAVAPLVLLCSLLLLNSVNPMQLAFITSFQVENQSGQDVRITPIGTVGAKGRKARLPVFVSVIPALPAIKTGNFYLKDGETLNIKYDWDDINFSEIAIESDDGQFFQLVIDPNPTDNRYHPPKSKHFKIPPLDSLSSIQPNIREATVRQSRGWIYYIVIVGSIALLVTYWKMIGYYRKQKTDAFITSVGIEG